MELKEIIAPTMKELFIKEMTSKILSGECKIGDRLPTEREMEEKMKVSRTIINSALAELARIGFVKIVPRHGVFVGDYIRHGNIDTLTTIMNFNGGKLNQKTFESLMAYRKNTECECAELAAKNRTEDDIKTIEELYDRVLLENDILKMAQLKVEFHHAIYCATGNAIYPLIYNSFSKLSLIFNEIIYKNIGVENAKKFLPELMTAIKLKKPHDARDIMNQLTVRRINELKRYYFSENIY